jgi:uroporphyrinogen III methyltransferase/synthase
VTVYLVGAGPGDPGLITVRGAELLARADVVVHDRLVDPSLLDLAPGSARRVDVGKRAGTPRSQQDISELLVDLGRCNETVVRLKGGDPFLFGRGGEEVEALLRAGVKVEVVPGITSAFAAPAYAGVPVTHRGLSTSVTVVTGRVGDPSAPGGVDWEALARAGGTIVVLMGMATRSEIARRLIDGGRKASTPVAVVQWGTTPDQRAVRATLGELASVELDSPATIVVGAVAGLELEWLEPKPLAGRTVVVTRPVGQSSALSLALRSAGATVVSLPAIAIVGPEDGGKALQEAVARIGEYDWVAFTSANAVAGFVASLKDARTLAGVKLAAVGAATASALAAGHLVADLVADKASAAGLVESIGPPTGGGRVLFCRAADALPTFARGLRQLGWSVDEMEVYRTISPGPAHGLTEHAVERARAADAVVLASPSAVRGLVALLSARHEVAEPDGLPQVTQPNVLSQVAVCIGESTASEARKAGFGVVAVAAEATDEGLVDATVIALSGRDSTVPSSTGPSSTGPSSTGPSSTGPSSTGPSSTGPPSSAT